MAERFGLDRGPAQPRDVIDADYIEVTPEPRPARSVEKGVPAPSRRPGMAMLDRRADATLRRGAMRGGPLFWLAGGLVVLETPNIRSVPFNLLKSRWRQFIPEHYFFFDPATITRLMETAGLKVERIRTVGKYASMELILNRLSRYTGFARSADSIARHLGLSHLTFRVNPRDIMLVVARRVE